jgi:hypothetical protein
MSVFEIKDFYEENYKMGMEPVQSIKRKNN